MRRIDKMTQEIQNIQNALRPAFFFAYVDKVISGWRVECRLGYDPGRGYDTRVSFCPDMDSVNRHIKEMRRQYPGNADPVVIIDDIAGG